MQSVNDTVAYSYRYHQLLKTDIIDIRMPQVDQGLVYHPCLSFMTTEQVKIKIPYN